MKRYFVIQLFIFSSVLQAQNPFDHYALSQKALAQGDASIYLKHAAEAYRQAPFNLTFAANLARAYAMNGQKTKCIELLDDLAVLGFDLDVKSDEGFRNVWNHSLVKDIEARAKKNAYKTSSVVAQTVDERDLIPEGIAYDPRKNLLYLSSIYKRKVISVSPDGAATDAVPEAQDGLLSTLGMKVDAARNHLWVLSTLNTPRARKTDDAEIGRSCVHQYDLETMRLIASYAPDDTVKHLFNDLVLMANGDVFLTDSEAGAVYWIDASEKRLIPWYDKGGMVYPNGITLSPDQKFLFVAHWRGIGRISIADTQMVQLTAKVKTILSGIDGMYFYDNALIAVQNGAGPQSRIMRFDLGKNQDSIVKSTVLESGHPDHNIPTTGVIVGSDFYYIANSQMQSFDDDGNIFPVNKLQPVKILKLSLTPVE